MKTLGLLGLAALLELMLVVLSVLACALGLVVALWPAWISLAALKYLWGW